MTASASEPPIPMASRLESIDALRGAAAMAVVLYHSAEFENFIGFPGMPEQLGWILSRIIGFGYTGVFLFFVISGFCIHLRWAKQAARGQTPVLNFVDFWKRRFRRLYPPYLVALALYLAIEYSKGKWSPSGFGLYDLFMHLFMLHNLDARTTFTINGVFWTLAIEEQLYLLYFVLLKMRGSMGWTRTLAVTLALRGVWFVGAMGLAKLTGTQIPAHESAVANWYSWALGAVSIEAALGLTTLAGWAFDLRFSSFLIAVGAALFFVQTYLFERGIIHNLAWIAGEPIWATGFFIVVNAFTRWEKRRLPGVPLPRAVAALSAIGLFSYSLYLTHEIVVVWLSKILQSWIALAHTDWVLLNVVVLSPASLLAAWVFFKMFEEPFINVNRREAT